MKLVWLAIGVLVALAVFSLLALNFTGFSVLAEEPSVVVGYKANVNYLPLFVALDKGFFSDEGLAVRTVRFDSTNTMVEAFAAGKIDATPTNNLVVAYSLENQHPGLFRLYAIEFFTDNRHPENVVVPINSSVSSWADLAGKTIGINKGLAGRTLIRNFLTQEHVPGVKIVELGDSVQLSALASGQIDALVSLDPNPTTAVHNGIGRFLVSGSVYKNIIGFSPAFSGSMISTRFLADRPDHAKRFLNAMKRAISFVEENPTEAKTILPKYISIDSDLAAKMSFGEQFFFSDLTADQVLEIQRTADFFYGQKIIEQQVETAPLLLDASWLD